MLKEMSEPWMVKSNLEKWLNISVKDIETEDDNAKNAYFCSNIKRLKVVAENGDVYPLFVKCKLEEGPVADMFRETAIFRKEQEIYGNTLKKLHALYRQAYPDAKDMFAPQCYHACENFLVMEDLAASGFKLMNKMTGLDLDYCLLVMRTLGRYQATSFVLHEREPDAFNQFNVGFYEEIMYSHRKMVVALSRTLADEIESWPQEWQRFVPKIRKIGELFNDLVVKTTHSQKEDYNVLVHGDLWTNNLLFQDNAAAIRMVDFQMAHYSSIGLDLHYFLVGSSTLEVQTKHWDQLIQEFHKAFCETLRLLGYKEKILTLDELLKEMDKKAVWGLYALVVPLGIIQSDPNCGFSFEAAIAKGETPGPSMYCENYKKTVQLLLPYYESKGAFSALP